MITDTERLDFIISAETSWYPGRGGAGPFGDGRLGVLCYRSRHRTPAGRSRLEAQGLTMRDAIDAAINLEKQHDGRDN